jgi:hypothetical protein
MKIKNHPPSGEPFVWLTRELLSSDAWRSQNIHTRRLIDFLLLEHIRRGGQNNGRLKAPQRQLYAFGIGPNYAVAAILRAEELGLVACHRAGMRTATTYRLTWLESHDGKPAGNEWRAYRNPNLSPPPAPKIRNLPIKEKAGLPIKGEADGPNLPIKQQAHARQRPAYQMIGALKRNLPGGLTPAGWAAKQPRARHPASWCRCAGPHGSRPHRKEPMMNDLPMERDRR